MQAKTATFVERAAVCAIFAIDTDFAIKTADVAAGRLQRQPAAIQQIDLGLMLALQVVLLSACDRAARSGGSHQVSVGQLQHQSAEQSRIVAQALVDAFLAEGVGEHGFVIFLRVMPGRTARNGRVIGLGVTVQIPQFPVGGLDVEHRDIQLFKRFAITAATGASRVSGIEARVAEQVDVEFFGELERVLTQ